MKRMLRGMPRLRNALVLGLAGLVARIPDDIYHPEVGPPFTQTHHFLTTLHKMSSPSRNSPVQVYWS